MTTHLNRSRRRQEAWGIFLAVLGLAGFSASSPAHVQPGMVRGRAIWFPIYAGRQSQPSGVIRVGVARQDYQRRGFYRIGVLPALVLDDVTIDVRCEKEFQQALNSLDRQLHQRMSGEAMELRRMTVNVAGETQPRLCADRGRLQADGLWLLEGNARFSAGGQCIRAARAWLTPAGAQAGQLRLQTDQGLRLASLFSIPVCVTNISCTIEAP